MPREGTLSDFLLYAVCFSPSCGTIPATRRWSQTGRQTAARKNESEFLFKERYWPENGSLDLPPGPGLGTELDESRIESRELLDLS